MHMYYIYDRNSDPSATLWLDSTFEFFDLWEFISNKTVRTPLSQSNNMESVIVVIIHMGKYKAKGPTCGRATRRPRDSYLPPLYGF